RRHRHRQEAQLLAVEVIVTNTERCTAGYLHINELDAARSGGRYIDIELLAGHDTVRHDHRELGTLLGDLAFEEIAAVATLQEGRGRCESDRGQQQARTRAGAAAAHHYSLTMCGVTMISRSRLVSCSVCWRNSAPTTGRSMRIGMPARDCVFSVMVRPPMTTVSPSFTSTCVCAFCVWKITPMSDDASEIPERSARMSSNT